MWNEHTDGDGITVTELDDNSPARNGLRDVYREQGYQQGYTRASRDIVALLVLTVEEFIRARQLLPAQQALLRDFHRYADRHLEGQTSAFTYVEQGLGI
jgi:hypothetical protein